MSTQQALFRSQQVVQQMIAEHRPIDDVLREITNFAKLSLPGALASIMRYNADRNTLSLAPNTDFSEGFTTAMQEVPLEKERGTCGDAGYLGEPVITEDIASDRRWKGYRETAEAEGLRACWSVPIRSQADGQLLGTLAAYYRAPAAPSEMDLVALQQAAAMTALAMVREQEARGYRNLTARYQSLYENHPDGVYEFDREGHFLRGNAALEQITGYAPSEYIGHHFSQFLDPDYRSLTQEAFDQALAGSYLTYETRGVHASGEPYDLEITNFPIRVDAEIVGVFGICRDISLRKEQQRQIAYQSTYDPVTGLLNRSVFEEHLTAALHGSQRSGKKVGVAHLNLDGFKPINESFGHRVGNTLLWRVAERLQEQTGKEHALARMVADEFVLLIPEVDNRGSVEALVNQLLCAVARPFEVEGNALHLSASAGLVLGDDSVEAPVLIQQADIAMEAAKSRGMNTSHWYEEERRPATRDEVMLRHDLRLALERNELELHYQPLVEAVTGQWHGVEALVRWHHPERGLISPGVFIPLAEQTGQIIDVGRWVLRRVCEDGVRRWEQGHKVVPAAVNISTMQFRRRNFVEEVETILAETGLPAHLLELEVTEGVMLENAPEAIELMQRLADMGVSVSIDDFGTGYSSLRYIRDLPASKVKLDISFIRDILTNPDNRAIVQSIINMAHHMNMKVVAEGVETKLQRVDLIAYRCDLLQGFLFSPAVPLAQLGELPATFPDFSDINT